MTDNDQAATATAVREVLEAVLERPIAPSENPTRAGDPDWDSLKHVELVFALEGALSIRYSEAELAELVDYRAIVDVTRRHVGD